MHVARLFVVSWVSVRTTVVSCESVIVEEKNSIQRKLHRKTQMQKSVIHDVTHCFACLSLFLMLLLARSMGIEWSASEK